MKLKFWTNKCYFQDTYGQSNKWLWKKFKDKVVYCKSMMWMSFSIISAQNTIWEKDIQTGNFKCHAFKIILAGLHSWFELIFIHWNCRVVKSKGNIYVQFSSAIWGKGRNIPSCFWSLWDLQTKQNKNKNKTNQKTLRLNFYLLPEKNITYRWRKKNHNLQLLNWICLGVNRKKNVKKKMP